MRAKTPALCLALSAALSAVVDAAAKQGAATGRWEKRIHLLDSPYGAMALS